MTTFTEYVSDSTNVTIEGRTHTITYKVCGDRPFNSALAYSAPDIPNIGDIHPNDPFAYCDNVSPSLIEKTETQLIYEVQANYTTTRELVPVDGNPLAAIPTVNWGTRIHRFPMDNDYYGTAIRNSAGDPFDPTFEADIYNQVLTYSRNEATYSALYAGFMGAVNNATFLGYTAGYVLCSSISAGNQQTANEITYYNVTFEFEFSKFFWNRPLLDVGYREQITHFLPPLLRMRTITDEAGYNVSSPVNLDGAGQKLPAGQPSVFLSDDGTATGVSDFQLYPLVNFSSLGIVLP